MHDSIRHRMVVFAAIFFGLATLCFSNFASANTCDIGAKFLSPTSVRVDGKCPTLEAARLACQAFASRFNQGGCLGGSSGGTQYYTGGNFRSNEKNAQGNYIWYYGGFHTPVVSETKPGDNAGPPPCPDQCFGDPVNAGTGNKFETHVEYRGEGVSPLGFAWTYNSFSASNVLRVEATTLGRNRTHSYSASLMHFRTVDLAYLARPDGKVLRFVGANGVWTADLHSAGRLIQLNESGSISGWQFDDGSGGREIFDAQGRLIKILDRLGFAQNLTYSAGATGQLYRVTDPNGRAIDFIYNASKLISRLNLPDGGYVAFAYTAGNDLSRVEYADGSYVQYLYDESGFISSGTAVGSLTGVVDEAQNRYSSTTYDAKSRAISTYLGSGVDLYVANYAVTGEVVTQASISLPGGATRSMNFLVRDGVAVPAAQSAVCQDCVSESKQYSYDTSGRPDVVTSSLGIQTDYDYGTDGRLLGKVEAANDTLGFRRTTQTDWHPQFVAPVERRVLDAAGLLVRKQAWSYNSRGQVLSDTQIDPAGQSSDRVTKTTYCEQINIDAGTCPVVGLVTSVDGPRSDVVDVTSRVYYPADSASCTITPTACSYRKGDLHKIVNALGQTVAEYLEYDGAGRLKSSRDANGVVTDLEYTPRGWLAARKVRGANNGSEADDAITRMEYDLVGQVKKVIQPDGMFVRYDYDAAHRLTDIYDNAGNRIHYTLDSAGNRTKEDTQDSSGALMRTLSRVYNQLGQLKTAKTAQGHATGFSYDANGNGDITTDALGRKTDNDYDPLDRLAKTLQDVGGINAKIEYKYDALDRLTQVTDPKGLNTTYGYNGLGDQIQLSSPDTGVTNFSYNPAGQVATKQDANDANPHTYTYDALGRPKTVSYGSGSADVEYDYDTVNPLCTAGETFAVGLVTAMRTEGTELKYCYDRFGRIVRKVQSVDSQSFTVRYAYTLAGQLQAMTYPDGAVADYVRDNQGRITEIGVTPAGGVRSVLLNNASYKPFGPVAGWTYGNGRSLARTYDQDYRPKTILDSASGGLSLSYGYNEVGELTQLKDGLQSAALAQYDYDTLGRLKVTRDGPTGTPLETYGYDATGNRTSLLHAGITTDYSYPSTSHRLSNVGGVSRSFDAVGNTTSIGGTAREFVYNANDRMSQVKQAGVVKASYRYNAKGERVSRADNATGAITGYTLYDEAGHWLGDYDANGATKQQAIWLGDAPVGLVVGAGVAQTLRYVQPDHLGTPRAVIDPSRNLTVWTWDAKGEAFGNNPPNQDPDQDGTAFVFDMRFPGQRHDELSGHSYNYFRDYDRDVGRYAQSDPLGLNAGINTYLYVGGLPTKFVDPLGLVQWNGNAFSISLRVAMWTRYQLRSECVNGVSYLVEVDSYARNWSAGAPLSLVGLPISFEDGLANPDPNIFNGRFAYYGAGFGFPVLANYSTTSLGGAVSLPSMAYGMGYEMDGGFALGGSQLKWAMRIECSCQIR